MTSSSPWPVIFGTACMMVYAIVIVMLKDFSKQYNVFVLGVAYLPMQFSAMLTMLWLNKVAGPSLGLPPMTYFPIGAAWWSVLALAMLYTLGSTLNYQSYATGGTVAMMSSMTLLMPVFASLLAYAMHREMPNLWQIGAYCAGVVMIVCMLKGSAVQVAAIKAANLAAQ